MDKPATDNGDHRPDQLVELLDKIPAAAIGIAGNRLVLNRRAEQLTGYTDGELSSIDDLLATLFGDAAGAIRQVCENSRYATSPVAGEFPMTTKAGQLRFVELSAAGTDPVICILHDVSQRRQAEEQLRQKVEQYRCLTDTTTDCFWVVDHQGKIIEANDECVRMLGYPREQLLTMSIQELEAIEDKRVVDDHIARIIANGYDRFETRHRCNDGRSIAVEVSTSFMPTAGRFLAFVRDVSERRRDDETLRESEERYRRFSALTTDYVYACNRRGTAPFRVQWMGGAVEKITGYTEEEIFAKGCWLTIVHPADRERVGTQLLRLVPGDTNTEEFRIFAKDGTIRWIREVCRCEAGALPDELRLFGTAQNITARKEAEDSLREIETIFNLFMEHSPIYVFFKDQDIRTVRLSRNFERMLGRPLQELIGTTMAELFPPELAASMEADDQRILREEKVFEIEEEYGGHTYYTLKFPIIQEHRPPMLAGFTMDITERKKTEETLRRLNEELDQRVAERTAQLEEAIREAESFSYSVSHDLRAPLRHINSYCSIILEDYRQDLPPEVCDYLGRVRKASSRLGELTDDLLELSRVSRAEIQVDEVNLSTLATTIVSLLHEAEPNRQVEFVIEQGLVARGDRLLLRLVMENLLGNAWKYTARTAAARIELATTAIGSEKVFLVRDNGAGFDMAYQDKLFRPFQRLHGDEFPGTGIGLATVKRIINRHGGRVWAEATTGRGATFYFTLPGI